MSHIATKWAERDDRLYITFGVTAASDVRVEFAEKTITVTARGLTAQATEPREVHSTLSLLKEIKPEESTYKVLGSAIQVCAIKKDTGYWNQLVDLTARQVKSWLSVDWNLWKDENDAPEDGRDAGFGGYGDMASMLGGGGAGGMDFSSMMQNMPPGDEDSDDDNDGGEDDDQLEDDAEEAVDEEAPKESEAEAVNVKEAV